MQFVQALIKRFEDAAAERERAEQEAFMADATDICDIEARLRAWDRRHELTNPYYPAQHGLRMH